MLHSKMSSILNINSKVKFDESITQEVHSYATYTSITVDSGDSIIIIINQENVYLLLSESAIYLEGKINDLTKTDGQAIATTDKLDFINNAICFLFDEIRLEMNGVEIDSCKNVGITSCMKANASFSENEMKKFACTGWENKKNKTLRQYFFWLHSTKIYLWIL